MNFFSAVARAVEEEGLACLVRIIAADGSVPRDAGAWMVVRPSGQFSGTIGGGALEWDALQRAHVQLASQMERAERQIVALGPALGQCCGGRVTIQFEKFERDRLPELAKFAQVKDVAIIARMTGDGRLERRIATACETTGAGEWYDHQPETNTSLLLFGAGHVARSLVLALAPLPFAVSWIETRRDAFPAHVPHNVTCHVQDAPQRALENVTTGTCVVVMTHSHALDLEIVSAALKLPALAYVGLIGSATKRARFASQLQKARLTESQINALHCPIGLPDLPGKEPSIIAASVAADLLRRRARSFT